MKKLMAIVLAISLSACGDFVDADGNTSFRQVAQGLQSLGDRVADMGEAIERDADVAAVPWDDLMETIPEDIDGSERLDSEGDEATDGNGGGMSIAHAEYVVDGDTMFVGVADLGALRSGVGLALRWVAPIFLRSDLDGQIDDLRVEGYPAIRIQDDDHRGVVIALIAEGRFAVVVGAKGRGNEDLVRDALEDVDYNRLEGWVDYGRR